MASKSIKSMIKLAVAMAMSPASLVPLEAGAAAAATCQPKKTCETEFKKVQAQDAGMGALSAGKLPEGQRDQGGLTQGAGNSKAAVACPAAAVCKEQKSKCEAEAKKTPKPLCQQEADCKKIDEMVAALNSSCALGNQVASDGAKTQAAAQSEGPPPAKGGGNDMMMGMLMGAAMGAGMAMLMNKDKEEEEDIQIPDIPYNGALQANGSIDCSKPDAIFYRDCNSQLEARCATMLDDPTCQQFSARYCGPAAGGNAMITVQPMTPPGVAFGVNPATLLGATGEGMASQYCKGVVAWNFCKGGGRESCPSCQAIAKNQSPACAQNPALCLAQNSQAEIEKAKLTCPMDPAFSDPSFAGGGTTTPTPTTPNGGLPAVVLPQSVTEGGAGTVVSTGGTGANSTGGGAIGSAATASGGGSASAQNGANREGYANGNSQAAYGAGSGTGGGGAGVSTGYAPASGGGREIAQAGGAAGSGYRPSSVSGPAPDVEGQYGPSLFTTSTQVIRKRCQAGKLNNCP